MNTQGAKRDLIEDGHGWGRLPSWQVAAALTAGRLRRLDTPAFGPAGAEMTEAYLARRIDLPSGPVASAFREALLGGECCRQVDGQSGSPHERCGSAVTDRTPASS